MKTHIFHDDSASPYNAAAEQFAHDIARLAEEGSELMYNLNSIRAYSNIKIRMWCRAALSYLETGTEPEFLTARFGYAVEEYVNNAVEAGRVDCSGLTILVQARRGITIPDFVLVDSNGNDYAWIDITSERSVGHIRRKGSGWDRIPFAAEAMYTDFDASRITLGEDTIASRAKIRTILRQATEEDRELFDYMRRTLDRALCPITFRQPLNSANLAKQIEKKFKREFAPNYKYPIINWMLQKYISMDKAHYKSVARRALFCVRSAGQNKTEAIEYIKESCGGIY